MAIGHAGSFSSGGGATGGGGNVTKSGQISSSPVSAASYASGSSTPVASATAPAAPTTAPVGTAAWYASEIASRESTAKTTTASNPGTANLSSSGGSTYTDPRTGLTFATEAAAASLGYGALLSTSGRTDPYAQALAALPTRAAQDLYIARNDDPYAKAGIGVSLAPQTQQISPNAAYLNRSDVYKPTDPKQLELMAAGYTAGQAAEMLRYGVSTPGQPGYTTSTRDDLYYETMRTQAWTSATGKSAAYHTWAKETGLPQEANPYEYVADLFTYAEKGYPTQGKDVFSPVDYKVLGLSDGYGGQEYIWGNQQYDLRGAMDVIAQAERSGEMGPYGSLRSYSSSYGEGGGYLPIETQREIGAMAAESRGERVSYSQWDMSPEQIGMGKFVSSVPIPEAPQAIKQPLTLGTFRGMNIVSLEKAGKPESITTTEKPSEYWIKGVPFVGELLAGTGIFKKTSEISEPIFKSFATSIAPTEIATTVVSQPRNILRSELPIEGGATFTAMFVDPTTGKKSQIWEEKIGEEYIEGGQAYQKYQIHDLSMVSVQTSQTFVTEGKSPYVKWEQGLVAGLPSSEKGESTVRMASLTNPYFAPLVGPGYVSEYLADTFMPSRSQEVRENNIMLEGVYGLRGQYTTFKESPTMSISSLGIGLVLGGVTRVGAGVYPTLTRMAGTGATGKVLATTVKYAPYALAGLYGADVVGRGTDYGTSIDYRSPGRIKGIFMQETVPMGIGMMVGYAPIRTARGVYDRVDATMWEYRQGAAGVTRGQGTGPIWEEPIITGGGRTGQPTPPPPSPPSGGYTSGGRTGYTPSGGTSGGRTSGYTAPSGGYTPRGRTSGSNTPLRSDGTVSPASIFKDTIEGRIVGDKFAQYEAAYKMRTYSDTYARTGNVKFKEYADLYSGLRPKGDIINPYTGAVEYRTGARGGMEYVPSAPKSNMIPRAAFAGDGRIKLTPTGYVSYPGEPFTVRYAGGKYGIQSGAPVSPIIPPRSATAVVSAVKTKATGFDKEISLYGGAGQLTKRRGGQLTVGQTGQLTTRRTGELTTRRPEELTQYKKSSALERVSPRGLILYEPGGKIAIPQYGGALTSYGNTGGLVTTSKGALTITDPIGKLKVIERVNPPRVTERLMITERPIITERLITKPVITQYPAIPKLGDLGGGGGASGGSRRGKRQFVEIFNVGLDLSTFGKDAYNWGGGPKGGSAKKTAGSAKRTSLKQLVKRVTGAKGRGKKK